jgi:hypothetical protein
LQDCSLRSLRRTSHCPKYLAFLVKVREAFFDAFYILRRSHNTPSLYLKQLTYFIFEGPTVQGNDLASPWQNWD